MQHLRDCSTGWSGEFELRLLLQKPREELDRRGDKEKEASGRLAILVQHKQPSLLGVSSWYYRFQRDAVPKSKVSGFYFIPSRNWILTGQATIFMLLSERRECLSIKPLIFAKI